MLVVLIVPNHLVCHEEIRSLYVASLKISDGIEIWVLLFGVSSEFVIDVVVEDEPRLQS